jgi:hypothetical protein
VSVSILPTIYGLSIILLGLYLFLDPIVHSSDIVASAILVTIIVYFLYITIASIVQLKIFNRPDFFSVEIDYSKSSKLILSNEIIYFLFKIVKSPFVGFNLTVNLYFDRDSDKPISIAFNSKSFTYGNATKNFSHRGIWTASKVTLELTDIFQLIVCKINFNKDCLLTIRVEPNNHPDNIDISINSSEKEGDDYSSFNNHLGDPYDIKKYNQSDGLKKIVWKIFARSGELLSRHSEPTMTPEGKTVIYVCGTTLSDHSYSAAKQYMDFRKSSGDDVLISASQFDPSNIFRDSNNFINQSIIDAFSECNLDSLVSLINFANSEGSVLKQILIFVDISKDTQVCSEILEQALCKLVKFNISPRILLVNKNSILKEIVSEDQSNNKNFVNRLINYFLFDSTKKSFTQSELSPYFSKLIQTCQMNQWDIH